MIGKFKLTINITLGAALLLIGLLLIWLFYAYPSQRDLLIFSSSVIAGLAAIYTAYYVAQTLHENMRRDVLHRSIEMLNAVSSPEMSKVREFIRNNLNHNELPKDKVFSEIYGNLELHDAVRSVLNQFEEISICIQKKYVDEDLMYTAIDGIVRYIYDALSPYITEVRKERDEPLLYCEIVKLANSWASYRYLTTGEILKAI